MFDYIYYSFYLFYQDILKEKEPHVYTILAISFVESLISFIVISYFLTSWYCDYMDTWLMGVIFIGIFIFNIWIYIYLGRNSIIIKRKPLIVNKKISKWIAIFTTISISSLAMWLTILQKEYLAHC